MGRNVFLPSCHAGCSTTSQPLLAPGPQLPCHLVQHCLQLPYVDQGDPDQELANDPLGLKQLGRAFGIGKKKGGGDAAQGKRKGK